MPAPDEERTGDLDYCFERCFRFEHDDGTHSLGFIDCYRRGSFVLEAKQSAKRAGAGHLARPPWPARAERLMRSAKREAEQYARALDEWPPFLVVVDVGRAIELWADFDRQGKVYTPFPDRARQRITLDQLDDPKVRAMLAAVWLDPMSLDPSSGVAEVTTDIAERLAWLVRSIGSRVPCGPQGDPPDARQRSAHASKTALFVTQCIFAMFADSVGLIEDRAFLKCLLKDYRGQAHNFHTAASEFFRHMDSGGHCAAVRQDLLRFNGGLFREVCPVQINEAELEALTAAAERDWALVEPAIFGTLLEQALDPRQRTELGAHYTPRAYVERLVGPTVMEPLRTEWEAVEGTALGLHQKGQGEEARAIVRRFHRELCSQRVLDPACGTGNFLYVAMRLMKELEGEVLGALQELGDGQGLLEMASHSVSPEQFLGIEKNRYAAWIAQMVLWIGHLQWHFRTFGDAKPAEPILRDSGSIECRDALIDCDRLERVSGAVQSRGGEETGPGPGPHRLFAEDNSCDDIRLVNPRPATWPEAEFIVGNPPFMGAKDLRRELGDGYVGGLWAIRQGRFRSADLVTVWWDRAACILKERGTVLKRFGFITTNSITQTFSRRVVESHLHASDPVRLVYAIADHPWIKGGGDHAAVRIAMTVVEKGGPNGEGRLGQVVNERGGAAVYVKSRCFDPFPFPDLDDPAHAELTVLAEELEATRDQAMARVSGLTMTGIYNLLERKAAGHPLSADQQRVFASGCIGVIGHLHARIDAFVQAAYGWAGQMTDQTLYQALLSLQRTRAREEDIGVVRHLRPDFQRRYQAPRAPIQTEAALGRAVPRPQFPQTPEAMAAVLLRTLRSAGRPVEPSVLMNGFNVRRRRAAEARIEETLSILAVAGSVQRTDAGWFAPRIGR